MSDPLFGINRSNPVLGSSNGWGTLGVASSGTNNTYANDLNNITAQYQNIVPKFGANLGGSDSNPANPYNLGFWGSDAFKNTLSGVGIGLDAFNGWQNYRLGKAYLNQAKDNLAFQKAQFNETYNNALKQYNTGLADRIRARAAFETGNSHAYDDEITANSMQRGQSGQAGSDYLNYKRSANA